MIDYGIKSFYKRIIQNQEDVKMEMKKLIWLGILAIIPIITGSVIDYIIPIDHPIALYTHAIIDFIPDYLKIILLLGILALAISIINQKKHSKISKS